MAYLPQDGSETDERQQIGGGSGAPPLPGGQPAGKLGVGAAPAGAQNLSGGYQNLQKFLQLNGSQAQGLASTIAGNVTKQAGGPQPAPFVGLGGDGPMQAPTPGPQTQAQKDAAQKATAANVQNLGSMGGRQALLSQYYGQPGYTPGQSAYDAYLLGGNAKAAGTLQSLQAGYGGLSAAVGGRSNPGAGAGSGKGVGANGPPPPPPRTDLSPGTPDAGAGLNGKPPPRRRGGATSTVPLDYDGQPLT